MLKIKILIIIFCCIGVVKAQTVIPPSSETPPGWIYYDGDEFNGDVIDSRYWGIYGSPKVGRPTYNQENKAMLQTYRPEQVFIDSTGYSVEGVITINKVNHIIFISINPSSATFQDKYSSRIIRFKHIYSCSRKIIMS